MFHREANSQELAEQLKKLELCVVQDVLPQELVDYADYVLPATYFMERKEVGCVLMSVRLALRKLKKRMLDH